MELGNLSVRLQLQSDIQEKLAENQKQIDAFMATNRDKVIKIAGKLDMSDIKNKIKDKISVSLGKVEATSVNLEKIKAQIEKSTFDVKVSPVLKFRKKKLDDGSEIQSIKIPAVVDKNYLIQSIQKALKGTEFTVRVGAGDSKPFNTGNAQTYQSKLTGIETTLTRLRRLMLSVYTVASSATILKNVIEIGGELQKQDIALQNLLGSERQQIALTSQIEQMAVKSPLSINQMYAGVRQLSAYGIAYNDLAKDMKSLGDIAAGTGVDLNRLTLAYGQVATKGVLQGQELRQFTEAGVPMVQALADRFTKLQGKVVTTADVYDMISKKMVSFYDVQQSIYDMTGKGGKFFDQQRIQAETLSGTYSNLKDKIDLMYKGIANMNSGGLKTILNLVSHIIEAWRIWVPLLTQGVLAFAQYKTFVGVYKGITAALTFLSTATWSSVGAWIANGTAIKINTTATSANAVATAGSSVANTGNAASTTAKTAATTANTVATTANTAAQRANAAASGASAAAGVATAGKVASAAAFLTKFARVAGVIGAIAFVAINVGIAIWNIVDALKAKNEEEKKAKEATDMDNQVNTEMNKTLSEQIPKYQLLQTQYKSLGDNIKAKKKFISENQQAFTDLGIAVNNVNDADRIFLKLGDKVIEMLKLRARIAARAAVAQRTLEGIYSEQAPGRKPVKFNAPEKYITTYGQNGLPRLIPNPNYDKEYEKAKRTAQARYNADVKRLTDWAFQMAGPENDEDFKKLNEIRGIINGEGDEPKKDKNTKKGRQEDTRLKALKEWFDKEKDFLSTYEKLAELYGKEAAISKTIALLGNPFLEVDENGNYKKDAKGNFIPAKLTPDNINQKAQRHTNKRTSDWYNNAWLTTPERRSTWRDMRMFSGEDLQIKIDTASFEADSEKVSKWMDKITKQYEEFRAIADKTGDEGLASRLVFGEDGVTQAKEYYDVISKLSGLMRSLGVARSIPSLMDMSDAELEEKYTGKVYEPMLNLIKRAREINQERIKDENDTLAEILAKNQSFADKMAAIYAKEQKQLRAVREDSMKEHPKLTNEQSNRAIDTIQKNAAKERGGLIFDEFTNSEYYKQMFDNLDVYSTKALENLQLHLKEVKAQAGELKPEDMKAYIDAVNKLQDILGSRRPFKGMSNALNAYYDYKGTPEGDRKGGNVFSTSIEMMRAYRDLQKEIDSLIEQQNTALDKKAAIQGALNDAVEREQTAQQKLDNAYERAAERQGIIKQKDGTYADSKGNTVAVSPSQLQGVLVTAVDPGIEKAKRGLEACRSEVVGWTEELGKADGKIAVINGKLQGATSAQKMMGESVRKVFSEIGNYANMAGEGFSSIMGIFGQEDSSFATIGSAAISGVGDIATGFATGGPIGGAIGGLKAIGGLVKGIAQAHDNKLNKAIEESQKRVTQLKNDYTAMQKVIERQLGGQTAAQSENMLNNLKKQRSELQGQMRDEEAKKKTDDAKVQDYKNQIAEMDDQIKYFSADLAKSLYDIDVKSWASELGDALFEAWQKGENGADAFKKKANDILASLTKNVMNKMIMEKALQPVYDYLFGDNGVFNDNALSDEDLIGLSGKLHDAEGITEQIYNWLDKINEGYKQNGMDVKNGTSDNSTSLTAGIKNITEETADLLAAYLNAIRADVSVMRSIQTSYMEKVSALVDIYAKVDLIKMNQSILLQENYLQQIAENSRQLLTLTESINASNQNMSDLFDRVSNGTKSLTVKVK